MPSSPALRLLQMRKVGGRDPPLSTELKPREPSPSLASMYVNEEGALEVSAPWSSPAIRSCLFSFSSREEMQINECELGGEEGERINNKSP